MMISRGPNNDRLGTRTSSMKPGLLSIRKFLGEAGFGSRVEGTSPKEKTNPILNAKSLISKPHET